MMANDIFGLAARQESWLLARQRVVAQNSANANTPGYKSLDIKPFEATLQSASLQLATTTPTHFTLDDAEAETAAAAKTRKMKTSTTLATMSARRRRWAKPARFRAPTHSIPPS